MKPPNTKLRIVQVKNPSHASYKIPTQEIKTPQHNLTIWKRKEIQSKANRSLIIEITLYSQTWARKMPDAIYKFQRTGPNSRHNIYAPTHLNLSHSMTIQATHMITTYDNYKRNNSQTPQRPLKFTAHLITATGPLTHMSDSWLKKSTNYPSATLHIKHIWPISSYNRSQSLRLFDLKNTWQ